MCIGIGKPNTPTLKTTGSWSISISITAPPNADTSQRIIYLIRYRKVGENVWHEYRRTSSTTVTVTHLYSFTRYVLTVKAKYQGGEYGPASDPLSFQTKCGKCCRILDSDAMLMERLYCKTSNKRPVSIKPRVSSRLNAGLSSSNTVSSECQSYNAIVTSYNYVIESSVYSRILSECD